MAKREGDLDRARAFWESVVGNSREGYDASEHLAIYYERDTREPQRALATVVEALAQLRRAHQLGTITAAAYRRAKARFEHRLARLERKTKRTLLDALDA